MGMRNDMTKERKELFDGVNPTYPGLSNHSESTFSFLNRSSRPASCRVRSTLEEWFQRYPSEHRFELSRRFQTDFLVGFFELLLHELLIRFNHKIQIHPLISSARTKRPDFRATDEAGNPLFLEAAVVTDESREERAQNKLLATLFDQINRLKVPDYFLRIIEIRNPALKQPSGKKLSQFISKCIEGLNYDDVQAILQLGAIDQLPTWTYKEEQLEIEFGVIPVSSENRGKLDHRFIGAYPAQARWCRTDEAIRTRIAKKGSKYGQLGAPYLVALNCMSMWGADRVDEMQALFGTEEFVFADLKKPPQCRRKPDGVWFGPKGPRNKRISGVLIVKVVPWNLPKADLCLYLNPWASYPYSGPLIDLPKAVAENGSVKIIPGASLGSVFSLPDSWPGQLFDAEKG